MKKQKGREVAQKTRRKNHSCSRNRGVVSSGRKSKFLSNFLWEAVPENEPIPGAVIAVQTFGDVLGFNPHYHILVTDGCFDGDGGLFRVAPPLELKKLEAIFRHKVLRMLLNRGKITKEMIAMLSTGRHSGFHVFCGTRISPTG